MEPELLLILILIALISGVGCTTIGPGGIFITISLYLMTPLTSAEVAGTAHITFIGVGIVGALGYMRSGELTTKHGHVLAIILSLSSIFGTLGGAYLNTQVSQRVFGIILGTVTIFTGLVLLYRQIRELKARFTINPMTTVGKMKIGALGLGVGIVSGLVGVGGPVLSVPALVLFGTPLLLALAVAQVQAIFISGFAAIGYLSHGAVDLFVAVVIGIPLFVGAVFGWVIAHRVDPDRLKSILGIVLVPVGVILII